MNNDFIDIEDNEPIRGDEKSNESTSEQAQHDKEVRKRIDDLLEKKRLKELLDDEDDWEIE
jgi:hypothetical protein